MRTNLFGSSLLAIEHVSSYINTILQVLLIYSKEVNYFKVNTLDLSTTAKQSSKGHFRISESELFQSK